MKNNIINMDLEAVEILLNDFNDLLEDDIYNQIGGIHVLEIDVITDPEVIAWIYDEHFPMDMMISIDDLFIS